MSELLTRVTGEEIVGLVAILGAFLTAITAVWAYNWRLVRLGEQEIQLKREMVNQGRSGAEIAEVIRAQPRSPWLGRMCQDHPTS